MKEQYIKQVEKELHLSRKERMEVLRDLNEIFASAVEHGDTEHQKILRIVPQNNSGLITHHHRNEKESFQVLSHFSLLLLLS